MPDHLQTITLTDFTAGLWERGNDRECPANGLLECTDVMPLISGGLRAAMAMQPMTQDGLTSGISAVGGSIPMGIYTLQGPLTGGHYVAMLDVDQVGAGTHRLRLLYLSGASPNGSVTSGTWTAVFTNATLTALDSGIKVAMLRNETNGYRAYFDLSATPAALSGIYRFTVSTSAKQFTVTAPRSLISFQARLLYVVQENAAHNEIQFTNLSTDALPSTANFVRPLAENLSNVSWISAMQPSDLVGMKETQSLFIVQGDINGGPLVREVSFGKTTSLMFPIPSDIGTVYHIADEGLFSWIGTQAIPLSPQILGDPFVPDIISTFTRATGNVARGQIAYGSRFIFAGQYIYDTSIRGWFKLSGMDSTVGGKPGWWMVDGFNSRIYCANYGKLTTDNNQVLWWSNLYEEDWARATSYAITLPVLDLTERHTKLRRIEIFGQGFGEGGSYTVTVTADGVAGAAYPAAPINAGAGVARLDINDNGSVLKIRIVANGTGLTDEAPMISRIVLYMSEAQTRPRS